MRSTHLLSHFLVCPQPTHCGTEWEREKALMLCKFTPPQPELVLHAAPWHPGRASRAGPVPASGYQTAVTGNTASASHQEFKAEGQGYFSKVHSQAQVKYVRQ